ncbi:hypothetical protein [Streptomyces sp. NPDC102264]|uniref:hypothetical protein n=1 Tax=Streptomyces sp. NPDC102264 TaxID=3366149 RepID=UPI003811BD9D
MTAKSGQHADTPPSDCPSCRALFAALVLIQTSVLPMPTTAGLEPLCGLKARAVQVHAGWLFRASLLDADRRTPLPGATLERGRHSGPGVPTPSEWAARAATRDRTCARCLAAYARHGWTGQIGVPDIAHELALSVRTVKTHRAHLVADGLLRSTPVPLAPGRVPEPDHYMLRAGVRTIVPVSTPATAELSWVEGRAYALLEQLVWWDANRVFPSQQTAARRALIGRFRDEWPDDALVAHLHRPGDHADTARAPYDLLTYRLKRCAGPYIPGAHRAAAQSSRAPMTMCPGCGLGWRPAPGFDRCRDCRDRDARALAG